MVLYVALMRGRGGAIFAESERLRGQCLPRTATPTTGTVRGMFPGKEISFSERNLYRLSVLNNIVYSIINLLHERIES